jgi:hypothetical protein
MSHAPKVYYWFLLQSGIFQSAPCNCDNLPTYSASRLSSNHSRLIHQSFLLWLQKKYLVAKRGETWREFPWIFATGGYIFSYFLDSLTCRKIFRHEADGFTSLPKEVLLRIFIALKNPFPPAGAEPVNLGSSDKEDNHHRHHRQRHHRQRQKLTMKRLVVSFESQQATKGINCGICCQHIVYPWKFTILINENNK